MIEARLRAVARQVPQVADPIEVEALTGGLTNTNYRVRTPAGVFVLRVAAADSDVLGIDREDEYANSVIAAEVGVGAAVIGRAASEGVMVVEYLEGRTLAPPDVRAGDLLGDITDLLRRLHAARPFHGTFDMCTRQRAYQAQALARGFPLPEDYLRYNDHAARIQEALATHPPPPRPCHNDLVAENLIATPAGLRLVDYDYAGNNDPCYDLAETWTESELAPAQLLELVGHYFDEPDPTLVARTRLWAVMSKYGWALWSVLRHGFSPDAEIRDWGLGLYVRAVREFEADDFDETLRRARDRPPPRLVGA